MKPQFLKQPGEARERRLASHNHPALPSVAHGTISGHLARQKAAMAGLRPIEIHTLSASKVQLKPVDFDQGSSELRPASLDQMVGQDALKPLLRRLIDNSHRTGKRLPHLLMVGASGTGKTTISIVVARELGARCFALKAPVDMDTLEALRTQARDGDVVFVDEVHMQVSGDRRGIMQACDPESFYLLLEDGILASSRGRVPFPDVTWIGATTDVGLLPEPLSNRFPLQPRLAPYTLPDMSRLATANASALGLTLQPGVAEVLASACRLNPRQLNSYMRNIEALTVHQGVTVDLATEVVRDLCGCTLDGLTPSMQTCLRYLYKSCRREYRDGRVMYACSVNQLATACGHGRDTKAISLLVEPWLIQAGLLGVQHTGRTLTEAGVERAKELSR